MRTWVAGRIASAGTLLLVVGLTASPVTPDRAGVSTPATSWRTVSATTVPTPAPRAAPGYAHAGGHTARVRPGNGPTETTLRLRMAADERLLWGDWWGRGTQTPVVFRGGRWNFYETGFGRPAVAATVSFGRRGDQPVVGDWDGDGRSDLGVVRGSRWHLAVDLTLRRKRTPASTWRRFRLGPATGQPLAGNFDGVGGDGVAVHRAGRWWVKQWPSRRAEVKRARFVFDPSRRRRPTTPVAGDWAGTGRDGVALVRGRRWRILPFLGARRGALTQRRVTRPRGARPAVRETTAGPDGSSCPWAMSPARAAVPAAATPGLHPEQPGAVPDATTRAKVREALARVDRYLLTGRHDQPWSPVPGQHHADVLASDRHREYAVRRPAMAALAVSVAVATGVHDPAATGVTRAQAIDYVEATVRSVACQHRAVSRGGWGRGWQTGHWAQLTALAAWLLWDELAAPTRAQVSAMLLAEANQQLGQPVEYWRDRHGAELPGREGNTAAEEMAWDVALLELAHIMFPTAPNAAAYRRHAVQWAVASYATPADLSATEPVNGVAPAQRLRGSNALDDGTVVNHHLVEPDYMGNIQHLWWAADFAQLAQTSTPAAVWHNARLVYGAFSTLEFTPGAPSASGGGRTYLEPGGTIYRRGTADLYYPDGASWGPGRPAPFMSVDAHALAYGLAPAAAWHPGNALAAHTQRQLALSHSSGDTGATYSLDPQTARQQDRYRGREEYAAQQVATAWLALHLAAWGQPALDERSYTVPATALTKQDPSPVRRTSP